MSLLKKSLIISLFLSMLAQMPSAHAGLLASTKNFFWGDDQSATSSAFRIAAASAMVAGSAWGLYKLNSITKQKDFDKEYPKTTASLQLGVKIAKPAIYLAGLYGLIKSLENYDYVSPNTAKTGLTLMCYCAPAYCMYRYASDRAQDEAVKSDFTPFIPKENFKNYAGEIPEEIKDLAHFLTNKEEQEGYKETGTDPNKGFLLWGPPGTGKTALIRALAGETKTPFYNIKSSELTSEYYGVTSKKIASIFKEAKAEAKKQENGYVIVFFDEIDAIVSDRNKCDTRNSQAVGENVTSFLTELDGLESRGGVIVIASTNRKEALDPAFLRSGRIDQHILLDWPTQEAQEVVLKYYLKKYNYQHKDDESKMKALAEKIYYKLNVTSVKDSSITPKEQQILGVHKANAADIELLVKDTARTVAKRIAAKKRSRVALTEADKFLTDADVMERAEIANQKIFKNLIDKYGQQPGNDNTVNLLLNAFQNNLFLDRRRT